ncbi:AraC family transcriptional regulator [Paenibacillus qinlingensis]|uniref:AraC-like DNA-binding protein n=1 Tax=Paenibacillus qinlingensis TaxID=1837343 RepID=A0ABU1NTJ3_9BACL|nr:AraC family transcriptional regulator [Paenibacillus qinlingensis]MDR6550763.1 AraC-like DNA-binding protein [Paenibacillus qinlingensis]
MICVALSVPPIPVMVTINKVKLPQSYHHPDRVFTLYDIILVRSGTLYVTEDNVPYEIGENQMLVLEPGKRHYGHRDCQEDTVVYYLHIQHPTAPRLVHNEEIHWQTVFPTRSYRDITPQEHFIYIPKFKEQNSKQIWSLLDMMIELHNASTLENMLPLQTMFGQLLLFFQNMTKISHHEHSRQVCDNVMKYLTEHVEQPFRLKAMAQHLNFSIDYSSKCLRKHTGLTPLQYLNRIRIQKARELLEHTNLTLREISTKVGIPEMNYFFRLFRKHTGMPPAKYRSSLYV